MKLKRGKHPLKWQKQVVLARRKLWVAKERHLKKVELLQFDECLPE